MKSLLFLILLLPLGLLAQTTLQGRIVNEQNAPQDFAEVQLSSTEHKTILQAFTNEKGLFEIQNITKGNYFFQILYLGQTVKQQNIDINDNLDLQTITINTASLLGEIIIESPLKLFERKIDRTVFNVENSIAATNSDAKEILKITPGIKVDDKGIALIGKGLVSVMINDKPVQLSGEQLQDYLQTIPSNNIKKIEIITTPPAQYQAEGSNGLINIVLKEVQEDYWSNQINGSYTQADRAMMRFGNSFQFNNNKLSLSANISGNTGDTKSYEHLKTFYPHGLWDLSNRGTQTTNNYSGSFLLDYKLTDNAILGFQYIGSAKVKRDTDTTITDVYNIVNNLEKTSVTDGKNKEDINNHVVNFYYKQNIGNKGVKLKFDLDYFTNSTTKDRVFSTYEQTVDNVVNFPYNINNTGKQNIDNFSTKIDIEQPLTWLKLAYGTRISFTKTTNKLGSYYNYYNNDLPLEKQKDNFKFKENTQAVYVSATKNIGDKWQTQFGLRLETTQTIGTSVANNTEHKKDYAKLFPSLYINYIATDDHALAINYSKRIARPSFWELNPFRWYANEFTYNEGNPSLLPTYTTSYELSHTYKNKLFTTLSISRSKDISSQYPQIDIETNIQSFQRGNIYNATTYSLTETYTHNVGNWLQSQHTAVLFFNKPELIKDLGIQAKKGVGLYFSTNNSFNLNTPKTIQVQLDFWYRSPVKEQLYDVHSMSSLSIGYKHSFINKKLQLSIYVNDMLKTSTVKVETITNTIKQELNMYHDNRYVRIGATYAFGNNKIKNKEYQGSNTEELTRK